MARLLGVDVSQFQNTIDWPVLNNVANFVMIRAAYGTVTDSEFSNNRTGARNMRSSAGPLGIGYYYYAYPTLLDAPTSAKYFVDTLGPLQSGEILALDLEGNVGPNPVAWALDWLEVVEQLTGVKPLIYLNQSEVTGYAWDSVVANGNALWLADYNMAKDGAMPEVKYWPIVAMVQWTDGDDVSGVPGLVDGDLFDGDFSEFYEYGVPPEVTDTPATPTPPPAPVVPPQSDPLPVPPATDQPSSTTTPVVDEPPTVMQPQPTTTTSTITATSSMVKPSWFTEWEQSLESDVNWFGTTTGGLALKAGGLLLGYLSVHLGVIHASDILTSFIGLLAGSTVHDSQKS